VKKFMILVLCVGVCLAICKTESWGCGGVTSDGNVKGNNHNWTHIGAVNKGAILRVLASGTVDLGCFACTCVDGVEAGVEGKSLAFVRIFDALKSTLDAETTLNPVEAVEKHINTMKHLFGSTHQPNFDQGGVWIKVLKKNGTPYIGTQLYYFWVHEGGINKYGLPIGEDVDVYAKAHDGGKDPENTSNYGDNKGAYNVMLFCGPQMPDGAMLLRGQTGAFMAAMKSGMAACTSPSPVAAQAPSSGTASSGVHTSQPVSQPAGSSAAATGTHINLKSCTNCVGACTAGHTCIYLNGACFVSCQ
jgi:hypothetical protein